MEVPAANKLDERSVNDFYPTPKSLIWLLKEEIYKEFDISKPILEPCCGERSISSALESIGYTVVDNDLYKGGVDYLTNDFDISYVITNPPFRLWDNFVFKAKSHADKVMMIGRTSYLGTHSRNISNIWTNLKTIYVFDRQIDYRTLYRDDGMFYVGGQVTAWFLWDKDYNQDPVIKTVDVQEYATLGAFKER